MKTHATVRHPAAGRTRAPAPGRRVGPDPRVRLALAAPRPMAKLTVGAPDDAFEREADRVADQVMRMPDPAAHPSPIAAAAPSHGAEPAVQRRCADCEEQVRRALRPARTAGRREGGPGGGPTCPHCAGAVRRAATATTGAAGGAHTCAHCGGGAKAPDAVATVPARVEHELQRLDGGGRPLADAERSFFEPRFGRDLGAVRLHSGPRAARLARALDARAFTLGRSIVFGAGELQPGSASGRHLLAHELTHVVQQGAAGGEATLRRWRRSGDRATSDRQGDTLWQLARSITGSGFDWVCIRPLSMASPKATGSDYYRYVIPGDEFDVSNLTATTGVDLRLHLFAGEWRDALLAMLFYPGAAPSGDPDISIETAANGGATPIASFVLFGHAAGDSMWGGAGSFRPADFDRDEPPPTFGQAELGFFPRRCWFTRNAGARLVGCSSRSVGDDFAAAYLRRGASVTATTADVVPHCTGILVDHSQTPPGCHVYNGLAFHNGSAATSPLLEGPFFSTADFHAGSHWATVRGKN